VSASRTATARRPVRAADAPQARAGLSASTLMIASASSAVAAIVVSKLWGGGTLVGAASTPVIVALVSEALRRPARVIGTVRTTRAGRFDPVAEGRRGLAEGDLDRARRSGVPAAAAQAEAQRRVHRASGPSLRLPRPRLVAAIATGLVAFVVAGVVLTGSELVLGKSSLASSARRTTYLGGSSSSSSTKDTTTTTTDTTATTTTTPTTGTTAPPTTTARPTTTVAPATPAPTVTTAPPAPPTATVPTAPAPAPNATPPAQTTP
jgi:hypothetical protein